ncbi:MAG TPA: DUF177 domain-containing protein [Terriglobales bacterium]|nr:DUF177 domain-containing protein [Terriglobales bacterium]
MLIRIADLEVRELVFQEGFQPGAIDLGPELAQQGVLETSGRAELVEEHQGRQAPIQDIRVVGQYAARIGAHCARCLEPVEHRLQGSFDLLYRPTGSDFRAPEVSISEAETEIGYYRGEGLLLEDVLREQILLALPARSTCSDGCKGLCPRCGRNLNLERCACPEPPPDARWAALEEIRRKLE